MCVAIGLSASGAEFHEPATANPLVWTRWEFPVELNAVDADGVQFDFYCDNLARFRNFVMDFVGCGDSKGYYRFQFEAPTEGKWSHVELYKVDLPQYRLVTSPGWKNVSWFFG